MWRLCVPHRSKFFLSDEEGLMASKEEWWSCKEFKWVDVKDYDVLQG